MGMAKKGGREETCTVLKNEKQEEENGTAKRNFPVVVVTM